MPVATCSDEQLIRLIRSEGFAGTAKLAGLNERTVFARRRHLEKKHGISINPPTKAGGVPNTDAVDCPHKIDVKIENGYAIIGSDAHIWPGKPSTAMRAFIHFCKELRPKAAVMNGDVMDFPQISRHPSIGWEKYPTVIGEIEAAQEQLHEIEKATPRDCVLLWTFGNHDYRFESNIANKAPEYAKVHGVHLKDHFPLWEPAWLAWINSDVVIKHRFKGGIHATHNNTLWSGKTTITGHLHRAIVTPFTDYNGTRYGVDTGCLADPNGPQFVNYTEANPKNWVQAFGVLSFKGGKLLPPELVQVWDKNHVAFRGELIKV